MAVVRNHFFLCSLLIIVGFICVVASLTRYAKTYTLGESLLKAGLMEDADAMKALVVKGARVDLVDTIGYNAVFYAVQTGDVELVRLLLEKGADPNSAAPNALTPLGQAICLKDPDLVRLLLSYGADPLFNQGKYNNCLILARQTNDDRIMELLGVTEVHCDEETHHPPNEQKE